MNDSILGENRPVYSPGDVVRVKGDSSRSSGIVVVPNDTYSTALVRWSDPEQTAEPEQWMQYVELEKLIRAPVQPMATSPGPNSVVAMSLADAQTARYRQLHPLKLDEIPMYGGHPTLSGQPGGQPVGGPNDTMGQRPQQPPNLKEGQEGDGQFLTDQFCSTCMWWDPDEEGGTDALGLPPGSVEGRCTQFNVDTGASQVCDAWASRVGYGFAVAFDPTPMEIHLSEEAPTAARFRKVSLRTGVVAAATPDTTGRMTERPLEFVDGPSIRDNNGDFVKIGFDDIIDSIKDPAFEKITVPESHKDQPSENTGYVVGYAVRDDPERPGEQVLELEHEITEPEIAGKIKRGSIFGSSVGLLFDYVRKSDLKKFDVALKHNALTNVPWVRGLGAHVAASEAASEFEPVTTVDGIPVRSVRIQASGEVYLGEEGEHSLVKEGKALSDGKGGFRWPIRNADELGKAKLAFGRSKPSERGKIRSWINKRAKALGLPKMGEAGASAAEQHEHEGGDRVGDEALQMQLAESAERQTRQQEEIDRLHADLHRRTVDDKVAEWSGRGLDSLTGFLAKGRELMMADDGGLAVVVVGFSDDGQEQKRGLTVTQAVQELVEALPFNEEGKLKLSEQASVADKEGAEGARPRQRVELSDPGSPASFDNDRDSVAARLGDTAEELGLGHLVKPQGGDS